MPIIGLSFNKIDAKKEKASVMQELKVNSTPVISGVKEVEVPNLTKKALSIEFEFLTRYDPGFASITIGGSLMYLTDKNKPIVDEFTKNKRLPEKTSLEVLNYLFRHCLLKASILADDLQLPPPMPMPKITPKSK
ncbi:MAG: hypothetical protein JSV63_04000 [Candidatus Aenigmatarchaeota archaeon]|nr:MAG: hypothetical protein JSV63_04000 [Candidatus Aenigmarchaeota archaeon]